MPSIHVPSQPVARVSPGLLACAPFQTAAVSPAAGRPSLNNVEFTRQEKNPVENKVGGKKME